MLTICCDASSDYARFICVCVSVCTCVCVRVYFVRALAHVVVTSHVLGNNNNNCASCPVQPCPTLPCSVVSLPCLALFRTPTQHEWSCCLRAGENVRKALKSFFTPETCNNYYLNNSTKTCGWVFCALRISHYFGITRRVFALHASWRTQLSF